MIEIDDNVMRELGQKVDNQIYILDNVRYKKVRTHHTKEVSYYVECNSNKG